MRTEHAQLDTNHGAYQADGGERYTRPALLLVGYRPNHSPSAPVERGWYGGGAASCAQLLCCWSVGRECTQTSNHEVASSGQRRPGNRGRRAIVAQWSESIVIGQLIRLPVITAGLDRRAQILELQNCHAESSLSIRQTRRQPPVILNTSKTSAIRTTGGPSLHKW